MIDAVRLAVGTLTAVPVPAPSVVDRATSRAAMLLAPLAVLPLAAGVVLVGETGRALDLPPLAVAFLVVGVLAAGTRALHWDGLSDVADGLTVSYEKERSLSVMKSGTSGPAGVVATVVVLGVQVAALTPLLTTTTGVVLVAGIVSGSRCALTITCARGVPAARTDGLGVGYCGTVPVAAAVLTWLLATTALAALAAWAGLDPVRMVVGCGAAVLVVLALVHRAVRRFGGVTGDVFGAAIELCFATLLLGAG